MSLSDRLEFRINGVERELRWKTLSVRQTIFGRGSVTASVQSDDGSYFPHRQDEVEITEIQPVSPQTTILARALIQKVEIGGMEDVPEVPTASRIVAPDSKAFAERIWVDEVIAAGTLKSVLQTLVTNYLSGDGITLDPAQVNGPDLTALTWQPKRLDAAFEELTTLTGYIIEIDADNVLRAFAVGTYPAPFDVIEGEKLTDGDLKVEEDGEPSDVNTVVVYGGQGGFNVEGEEHDGDGVSRRFRLNAPIVIVSGVQPIIVITVFQGSPPLGFYGGIFGVDDLPWTYDVATQELVQRTDQTIVGVGESISVNYHGQFPVAVTAQNLGSPPEPVRQIVFREPSIFNIAELQAKADAELAKRQQAATRRVWYSTFEQGIKPGQSQLINVPMRNINATVLITDVVSRDVGADWLRRDVTAIEGLPQGSWRDWYRNRLLSGGTGAGVLAGGSVSINPVSPPASSINVDSILTGSGHPQGVVSAVPGKLYRDVDTGWLFRKLAGNGNTGWYPIVDFFGSGAANLASGIVLSAGANDNINAFGVNAQGGSSGVAGEAPKFQPDGVYRAFKTLANQFVLYGRTWDDGFSATYTRMSFQHDFDLIFRIVTDPTTVSAVQYWFGVASTNPTPSTDTAGGHCIWFRFSTTASDPGWVGVTNDNTGQSVTGLVGTIAANTAYVLRIRKVGGTVYFSVNDGPEVSTSSKVPSAHNAPFGAAYVALTTASPGIPDERTFYFGRVGATIAEFAA